MKSLSTSVLLEMKKAGKKIACLTAYDATLARVMDTAGVHVILVGDSLGMVVQGRATTLGVRMRDMIYHSRLVSNAVKHALIVADMPFMSYRNPQETLRNAGRLVGQGGAHAVKLEGGRWLEDSVFLLSERGLAVCGHLGLTPQSVHKFGGYRVQGRSSTDAATIREDARCLVNAGAKMLVLECVPRQLAADITLDVDVPVIGIGASVDCDGQVLVCYDVLGLNASPPRFVHDFLANNGSVADAFASYVNAVKEGRFPGLEHTFD